MANLTSVAKRLQNLPLVLVLVLAMASAARAQWLNTPPAAPRTPDGKPNLLAPAPRTPEGKPDLSGLWHTETFRYVQDLSGEGVDLPMLPSAAALYKQRRDTMGAHNPQSYCMPHSVPSAMLVKDFPFKIIQTPRETVVLYEEFNQYRQIFTDGRTMEKDPNPAWFGYSTGKWEGDTFVVEVAGFKEGNWLDNSGHPLTEVLRITERYHRLNFGSMDLDVTINDPGAYLKAWNAPTIHFKLFPDGELIEHLCENEKDAGHLKVFDAK